VSPPLTLVEYHPVRYRTKSLTNACALGERAGVVLCNCNKNGAALAVRVAPSSCCVDLLIPPPRGALYFFTVAAVVAAADTHASEGEVKMLSLAKLYAPSIALEGVSRLNHCSRASVCG